MATPAAMNPAPERSPVNTPNTVGALNGPNGSNVSSTCAALNPFTPDAPDALNALIGQPVAHIDTPAAVVDLDAMERNIARMADFARQHRVRWRPHAKMHKSAALALQLQRAGACGACVQKTSEAEALAAGGVLDLYISNEVVDPAKLRRVARLAAWLAERGGQLALAVDSSEGIARLAAAMAEAGSGARIGVFVEIDVGQGRCGVPPGAPAAALGERLWLVPGHCDPTVNLHDVLLGVRGGLQHGVVECCIRVDARGALT